jgi:hypothetical protein
MAAVIGELDASYCYLVGRRCYYSDTGNPSTEKLRAEDGRSHDLRVVTSGINDRLEG